MNQTRNTHHIIIVGGGAGGLELAARLGDRLGKRGKAEVTLVDAMLTHVWKPLLHAVAAGTLDSHEDDIDYLALGRWHHFRFRLGRMIGLDRANHEVIVAPTLDEEGNEIIPRRTFRYDTLILAVGSVTNDFGTEGVKEHCMFLDSRDQADRFHQQLLRNYLHAHTQADPVHEGQLHVAIVGAGATGVELAAELHDASRQFVAYGLDRITPERDVRISIIEAAERVLPALPPRISAASLEQLRRLGIQVYTGEQVGRATAEGLHTSGGRFIPALMKVWAAGIKAPAFLRDLDGLETNRRNQLVVKQNLQTTRDPDIFAFGDCAACPQPGSDQPVPPRAQAAHQQAQLLARSMAQRLAGEPLPVYVYRDYGSLISLSRYTAVGSLMGKLTGRVMVEGLLARLVYISLYKRHLMALHGAFRVVLSTLANVLKRGSSPRMKLH
ncbi:MAG: NAD(P)/FAD-dependent oxidoreductase [Gammaproteobacteria bacterium]